MSQTMSVMDAVTGQLLDEGRWPPNDLSKSMGADYHYILPTMINFLTAVQVRLQNCDPVCQFAFDDAFANTALGQDVQTLIGAIDGATA